MDVLGESCRDVQLIILDKLFGMNPKLFSYIINHKPNLDRLHPELLKIYKTRRSMQLVCKKWKELSDDRIIWGRHSIPLMICIQFNLVDSFRSLINKEGAELWRRDSECLDLAMRLNRVEIFDILIQNPSILFHEHSSKNQILREMFTRYGFQYVEKLWEAFKYDDDEKMPRSCLSFAFKKGVESKDAEQICTFFFEKMRIEDKGLINDCFRISCARNYPKLLMKLKDNPLLEYDTKYDGLSSAAKNDNAEIIDILINEFGLDPSLQDQRPLKSAMKANMTKAAMRLLDDPRMDVTQIQKLFWHLHPILLWKFIEHPNVPYVNLKELEDSRNLIKSYSNGKELIQLLEHPKVRCYKELYGYLYQRVPYYIQNADLLKAFLFEKMNKEVV